MVDEVEVEVGSAVAETPLAPRLASGVLDVPVVPLETAFPGRLTTWEAARALKFASERLAFALTLISLVLIPQDIYSRITSH